MPVSRARRVVSIVFAVGLLSAGTVLVTASPALAAGLTVGPSGTYATISDAVAASSPGDVIDVAAGTYTESVDVTKAITLEGAGAGSTFIVGTTTLDAPVEITGLTLESQTTVPTTSPPFASSTLIIAAGGAGSYIHNNVLANGYQDVYALNVVGSTASPTVISNNTIRDFHADQGTGVWIAQSSYFTVSHNTITDAAPIDDNAVGVNLVCGSSHVTIDSNTISNVGNATVDIANGSCDTSTDVAITNNSVGPTSGSALYFGANNLTDITISGNSFHSIGGASGAVVLSGASAWLASSGVNISGFVVESNSISGAANGLYVGDGVLLDGNASVISANNAWCSSGKAIDNLSTGGFTVQSLNDNGCPLPAVTGTVPKKSSSALAAAAITTPAPTQTPTSDPLAITGGSSGVQKPTAEPQSSKKLAVATGSASSPLPWILLLVGALVLTVVIVYIVRRARQI